MRKVIFSAIFVLLLAACAPKSTPLPEVSPTEVVQEVTQVLPSATPEVPLEVTVSILPQQYFVERIGGNHVNVNVMVQPGESPATYEPKPEQMTALSNSAAYFSIGVPFENAWLEKITAANTDMMLVDTTQGIDRKANGEGGFDPHIWLSPSLVKIQSETIMNALVSLDPVHAETYQSNYQEFMDDIDNLDSIIRDALAQSEGKSFIVFHPAWGYFASDYGLEMISIEVGGQEPSAKELAEIIQQAKEKNIKIIFAQPEFSQEAAKTIASEIEGEVMLISPLNPDWLNNMKNVADTFAKTLK